MAQLPEMKLQVGGGTILLYLPRPTPAKKKKKR